MCFFLQVHRREGGNPHALLLTRDGTRKSGTEDGKAGGKVKRNARDCPSEETRGFSVSSLSWYFCIFHLFLYDICTMPRYCVFFSGDNNFFLPEIVQNFIKGT